jgi:hypothetical protein
MITLAVLDLPIADQVEWFFRGFAAYGTLLIIATIVRAIRNSVKDSIND